MLNFGAPSQPREKGPVRPVGLAREGFSYFGTWLVGCLAAMSAISAILGAAWLLYECPGWLFNAIRDAKISIFWWPWLSENMAKA